MQYLLIPLCIILAVCEVHEVTESVVWPPFTIAGVEDFSQAHARIQGTEERSDIEDRIAHLKEITRRRPLPHSSLRTSTPPPSREFLDLINFGNDEEESGGHTHRRSKGKFPRQARLTELEDGDNSVFVGSMILQRMNAIDKPKTPRFDRWAKLQEESPFPVPY